MFELHYIHLSVSGDTYIYLMGPASKILSIQVQHGIPVLYVMQDVYCVERQELIIRPVLTGRTHPTTEGYLGTAMLNDGAFVVHFFKF